MNGFADFLAAGPRGIFRPQGTVTLDETIALVAEGIAHARELGLKQLLVDTTNLTGHNPPDTFQRYYLMNRWGEAADGRVQVALLIRPEMMDPGRFGLRVAENRGFVVNAFLNEEEALAWLDAG